MNLSLASLREGHNFEEDMTKIATMVSKVESEYGKE